jgi:hypothetical protein
MAELTRAKRSQDSPREASRALQRDLFPPLLPRLTCSPARRLPSSVVTTRVAGSTSARALSPGISCGFCLAT